MRQTSDTGTQAAASAVMLQAANTGSRAELDPRFGETESHRRPPLSYTITTPQFTGPSSSDRCSPLLYRTTGEPNSVSCQSNSCDPDMGTPP